MADYLQRLALALPLICLLAVALLIGWRRLQQRAAASAWRWPSGPRRATTAGGSPDTLPAPAARWFNPRRPAATAATPDLLVRDNRSIAPGVRLCVVQFNGADHLLGITGNSITPLAQAARADGRLDARRDVPQPHGLMLDGPCGAGLRPTRTPTATLSGKCAA